MSNARVEFEEFIAEVGIPLICAVVIKHEGSYFDDSDSQKFELRKLEDLPQFLGTLDFEYNGEKLRESICWFEDGSWGDIGDYNSDGIDIYHWSHRSRPEIPSFTNPL